MFEDFRTKVMTVYSTLHGVAYPTVLVNYPNRINYDPEGHTDPFVIFSIVFNKTRQLSLGQRDLQLSGRLLLHYLFRPGTGSKQSAQYSDFILDKIALRTLSGIVFQELTPYTDSKLEGWDGTLNVVPFTTQYFNI
jgi:hypothetical protein